MPTMNLIQAVNDALRIQMRNDPRAVVLGEDVGVKMELVEDLANKHWAGVIPVPMDLFFKNTIILFLNNYYRILL